MARPKPTLRQRLWLLVPAPLRLRWYCYKIDRAARRIGMEV